MGRNWSASGKDARTISTGILMIRSQFTLMDVGRDVVFPLFQMMKLWDSIHLRYQRRRIGGPGSYRLAQRVDIMSQMVWECQYSFPELRSDFKQLSTELRDRATELQVGPARKLYYPMPRLLGY
jgi:hypothetical protein